MTCENDIPTQADPASHEPSAARSAGCAHCGQGGETRAPDPTDRYMRQLDRLIDLGTALTEDLVADAREAIAARRAARAASLAAAAAATPVEAEAVPPAEAVPAGSTLPGSAQAAPVEPEPNVEALVASDPAQLGFQRMTKAVRLCMALAIRFHNDRLDREAGIVRPMLAPRQPRGSGSGSGAGSAAGALTPAEAEAKAEVKERVEARIERETEPEVMDILYRALDERLGSAEFVRDLKQSSADELVERICEDLGIEGEEEAADPPFKEAWPGAGMPLDGEAWTIDFEFFRDLGMLRDPVPTYVGPPPFLRLIPYKSYAPKPEPPKKRRRRRG